MKDLTHEYNYSSPDQHTEGRAPTPFTQEHLDLEIRRLRETVDRLRAHFAERNYLSYKDAVELNRSRMLLGILEGVRLVELGADYPPTYIAEEEVPGINGVEAYPRERC